MMIDFTTDVEQCLAVLQSGGLILYPTDTIWGIGCDATQPAAVEKINRLKERGDDKSFVVLVASEKEVIQYAASVDLAVFAHLDNLSKPATVIYEHAIGLADNVLATDGSAAIRICKEPFCKHLIKRFRKPIVSTSANKSGMPAPAIFAEISAEIKSGVDYIVQYRQEDRIPGSPSTLLKWGNGSPIILRS